MVRFQLPPDFASCKSISLEMQRLIDAREAKQFLASQIIGQATFEGVALSELERKMLYFSETGWTLPDMAETAEAFEREYDETEYERKVAGLIRNLHKRLRKDDEGELRAWSDAVRTIGNKDHYIQVLIEQAGVSVRPPRDLLKLWGTGFAICAGFLVLIFVFPHLDMEQSTESLRFLFWAVASCIVAAYLLFYMVVGKSRAIDITNRFIDRILAIFEHRE
jgi:hypothetical protein